MIKTAKDIYLPKLLSIIDDSFVISDYKIKITDITLNDLRQDLSELPNLTTKEEMDNAIDIAFKNRKYVYVVVEATLTQPVSYKAFTSLMISLSNVVFRYTTESDSIIDVIISGNDKIFSISGSDIDRVKMMDCGNIYSELTGKPVDEYPLPIIAKDPNLFYNGSLSLSPKSQKKLSEFKTGDVLYYKPNTGLVS